MSGHLAKLLIESYSDVALKSSDLAGSYEVLFNPTTYSRKYDIEYDQTPGTGSSGTEAKFGRIKPQEYSFEFLFDGTGASGIKVDVHDDIEWFLETTGKLDGDIHRPRFLKIVWGTLIAKCVLKSANVNYTLFKPDGRPLRAKVTAVFTESIEETLRVAEDNKNSPDLTHTRYVQQGDNLPLMTYRIYGDTSQYARVARFNRLDGFRRLTPGQAIHFPPLDQLLAET